MVIVTMVMVMVMVLNGDDVTNVPLHFVWFSGVHGAKVRDFSLKDREHCLEIVAQGRKGLKKYSFSCDTAGEGSLWSLPHLLSTTLSTLHCFVWIFHFLP